MTIGRKAIISTFWTTGTTYIAMAVGFVFGVLRDRILQPYDNGIYAFGMATVDLLFILSALSFNISVIQADEKKEDLYSTAFILTIALSLIMMLASLILAYVLSIRGTTDLKISAFLVLASASVLNLFSMLFSSYLEKQLEYKRIARINLLSVLAFPVVSLFFVYHGWGAWGMILGQSASFLVSFTGMLIISRYPFGFRFSVSTAKWFLSMGWKLIFSRGMEVMLVHYGTFVTERLLGTAQQGSYNRVVKYWQMAPQTVAPAVVTVALPTYSKLQQEGDKLSQAFSLVLFFLTRALLPFVLIFLFLPEAFIRIIGTQWLDGVPVLRILAISALLSPLFENVKQLIISQGKPEKIVKTRIVQLLVFIPSMYFFVDRYGISGAAIALTLNYFIGAIGAFILVRHFLSRRLIKNIAIPFLSASLAGCIQYFFPMPGVFDHSIPQFFLSAFYLIAIFFLFEIMFEWKTLKEHSMFIVNIMRNHEAPTSPSPVQ